MHKRAWCALLVGVPALLFLVRYFGIDKELMRSLGIDNPNLPRIKRAGSGDIVIEISEEEENED